MNIVARFVTAFRFARRDLRSGIGGFKTFLISLALGVATIAAVGSLTASIVAGLQANGRAILAGDVDIRSIHLPLEDAEVQWLKGRGQVSETIEMRTMARHLGNDKRTLVELKSVDGLYPLAGELILRDGRQLATALAGRDGLPGAVIEGPLADRFRAALGDRLKIGQSEFVIQGIIQSEPDRMSSGALNLGPRVMISAAAMAKTGLVQVGSISYHHYRVALPPGADINAFLTDLKNTWPDHGWRIRDRSNGAPQVTQFMERLRVFLTLVGLTALLVGGVGVGNAVRGHMEARTREIAVLKCIGGTSADISRIYLMQVMILAAIGIFAGLTIGALAPVALSGLLSETLPVAPEGGLYLWPLLLAATFGVLVTLAFALWPLGQAERTNAAGLFRATISPTSQKPPVTFILGTVVALTALCALAIATTPEKLFATAFIAGAAILFGLLRLAAMGVKWLARRLPAPRRATLRMAIANLHRPGAPTGPVIISLGLGLTLIVAVAQIDGNMRAQINDRLPEDAPAFFFVDIQNPQLDDFLQTAKSVPGVGEISHVPSLRGRITRLNDTPAAEAKIDPEAAWVLRGDRGLTYSATPPENSPVVAGEWWPEDYAGPPLISFAAEEAKEMGLKIGDTLTVNVLGRDITATIYNLRQIEWGTFGINFLIVFDANTLRPAPHSHLATAQASPAAEDALYKTITDKYPNVSAVRMKEALAIANDIMEKIGTAIRASAGITLISGIVVLGGAIAAGHQRRVREAVILKVLGATRRRVLAINAVEYLMLGGVTAVIAALAGTAAARAVVEDVMRADFIAMPVVIAISIIVAMIATLGLGLLAAGRALGAKPAQELRID